MHCATEVGPGTLSSATLGQESSNLTFSSGCHLPYGKLLFSSQHARVFWYKIAKGQGFSVTNFLQLQSEKSSDKTRVWFGKFENFDFIPESRGRLSP